MRLNTKNVGPNMHFHRNNIREKSINNTLVIYVYLEQERLSCEVWGPKYILFI